MDIIDIGIKYRYNRYRYEIQAQQIYIQVYNKDIMDIGSKNRYNKYNIYWYKI